MTAPTMPADCRVETLHFWLDGIDNGACAYHDLARAVRALLEVKVREAVAVTESRLSAAALPPHGGMLTTDAIVSRVLGAP